MSTTDNGGQWTEQQTPPMAEAGCKDKVDRTVQGTALAGFAELRARLSEERKVAEDKAIDELAFGAIAAAQQFATLRKAIQFCIDVIDELEADAKDAST